MKASLEFENIDFLEQFFPDFKPQLSRVQYIGTISIFSFFFESEDALEKNWESITSSIAVNYQSEFEEEKQEFERWNIYILFIVKGRVESQLKYKIENDKFSSRKIIQDNVEDVFYADSISELILKNIVNSDLNKSLFDDSCASDKIPAYSSDSIIYRLVDNYQSNNSGKSVNKGMRKRANRDAKKEEIDVLYQQIIKEIGNEI